ncbi:hypothetical protein [Paenibacillus sp. SYP-B4298]|uniref:hypothetical protein n=1 Tax=Paenibacillus sp. SYP-B4298 TaxID=2996034 RepID=UPI0022DD5C04|nr:hypothetical protein [Paenibacillus sp. SYP-B4298]
MDKRTVVAAYRRGYINLQECAQILGLDSLQVQRIIEASGQAVTGEADSKRRLALADRAMRG